MKNISKGTIVRTILLVLTMVNSGLALFGKSPLPIADEQVTEVVSFVLLAGTSLMAWWKNNSFTAKAIEADKLLKESK